MKITMTLAPERSQELELEAFSNADFAGDKAEKKSMADRVLRLNGMAVSWGCWKQDGVSLSITEAEYVAASEMARELPGLREMLS